MEEEAEPEAPPTLPEAPPGPPEALPALVPLLEEVPEVTPEAPEALPDVSEEPLGEAFLLDLLERCLSSCLSCDFFLPEDEAAPSAEVVPLEELTDALFLLDASGDKKPLKDEPSFLLSSRLSLEDLLSDFRE